LIEAIRDLGSLDEDATLYVREPWTADSETIAVVEPSDFDGRIPPPEARGGCTYFLEVSIAREVMEGWLSNIDAAPPLEQRCARVIHYAIFDA